MRRRSRHSPMDRRRRVQHAVRREDGGDLTAPRVSHADRPRSASRSQRSQAASQMCGRGPCAGSYRRLARTNGFIPTDLRPTARPRCGQGSSAGPGCRHLSRPHSPRRSEPTSRTPGNGARDRPRLREPDRSPRGGGSLRTGKYSGRRRGRVGSPHHPRFTTNESRQRRGASRFSTDSSTGR